MKGNPFSGIDWYDLHWLSPKVLSGFTFEYPILLYFIPLVPLLFLLRWLLFLRFRQRIDVAFFEADVKTHWSTSLRHLPNVFLTFVMAFSLFALARPQLTNERVEEISEGIDILLALDVSESMTINDLKPDRLEAAKKVARDFILGRIHDRIGLVVFAGEALNVSPLTTDYALLNEYIDQMNYTTITKGGTAIGSAIGVCINHMLDSKSKTKIIILLSDGDNTAGNIDPATSAQLAKAYGLKIYTIGVGSDGPVLIATDMLGNPIYGQNTMDETALKTIAQITQGRYFRATNNEGLKEIFNNINKLEKSNFTQNKYQNTADFYHIYLYWAAACFIGFMVLKSTFVSNPLED
jgi:Ca-activated chloride channel family protein